jgi:hypothetical protein
MLLIYFEMGSHYVTQAGCEHLYLAVLFSQPPKGLGLQECTTVPAEKFFFDRFCKADALLLEPHLLFVWMV